MRTQTGTHIDTRLFVGGAFVEAEGGGRSRTATRNGEVVSEVASRSGQDARGAVEAAAAASPSGRRRRRPSGRAVFLKAADVLESRQDEVVSMLARGDRLHVRLRDVPDALRPGLFRQAAALAYAPLGEVIPSDSGRLRDGRQASRRASSARSPPGTPR
jgi:acyl-CoA reductase-like NAD-dependent aldehyde dehydrogenase